MVIATGRKLIGRDCTIISKHFLGLPYIPKPHLFFRIANPAVHRVKKKP